MLYRTYRPAPPLSRFVHMFWLYQGERRAHQKERLLPGGTTELVVNLREDCIRTYGRAQSDEGRTFPGSVLIGAHSEYFVIDTEEQDHVMGVHFRPGGAFPFFPLPASELRDQHVALEDIWTKDASRLREQLLGAPTPETKFQVFEQLLLSRTTKPLLRHPAVSYALGEFRATQNIADVTAQIGLSPRRFIDVFSAEVGLTPKLFCRIRRFQRVLRSIQGQSAIDWAAVATGCGYFDQAHFNHDFRSFSGINPTTYLAQRTEHLNHVPLLD